MSKITDSQILFRRWFESAICVLEHQLKDGDGAIAGLMVTLPLYERFNHIKKAEDTTGKSFYQLMAEDLQLPSAAHAEKFWKTFRHGFCHSAMPFEKDLAGDPLPGVSFHHSHPTFPGFGTDPKTGGEVICLNPWAFIHRVLDIYRADPKLLDRHANAPLLPIHIII